MSLNDFPSAEGKQSNHPDYLLLFTPIKCAPNDDLIFLYTPIIYYVRKHTQLTLTRRSLHSCYPARPQFCSHNLRVGYGASLLA